MVDLMSLDPSLIYYMVFATLRDRDWAAHGRADLLDFRYRRVTG